ncbi:MAG: hypothetical protein FWC72_02370 [Oscillospiraceae bacterium]|nr:hypothetical protein [Oscillospiraceae bacterium]
MRNLIRADVYKIVRGKALYITFAVLLVMIILNVTTGAAMITIVAEDGGVMAPLGIEIYGEPDGLAGAVIAVFSSMEQLVFVLLSFVMLVSVPIFSSGTVKNDIARGVSRTKLYLSKMIICGALCILMYLVYLGVGMLSYVIVNGLGSPTPAGFWATLMQAASAQLFILLAISCVGLFLVFTTKRSGMVIGIYIAFFLLPTMLLNLLSLFNADLALALVNFDMTTSIGRLGFFDQLRTGEILTVLGVGAGYILASTTIGLASFRKAEIK